MYFGNVDIRVAQLRASGTDLNDVVAVQEQLEAILREEIPLNLVNASIHRVTQMSRRLGQS